MCNIYFIPKLSMAKLPDDKLASQEGMDDMEPKKAPGVPHNAIRESVPHIRSEMHLVMEAYAEMKQACQQVFEKNAQMIERVTLEDEKTSEKKDAEWLNLTTQSGSRFSISRSSPKDNDFRLYFNDDVSFLQVDYSFVEDGSVHKRVMDSELPHDEDNNARIISESTSGYSQAKRLAQLINDAEVSR